MNSESDPYRPPEAPLIDADGDFELSKRPPQVILALRLLYGGLAIGLLTLFIAPPIETSGNSAVPVLVIGLVSLSIMLALFYAMSKGYRWARVVYTVVFIFGLLRMLSLPEMLLGFFEKNPVALISSLIQTILGLVAILFLFAPAANRWFRAQRLRRVAA